MQALGMAGAVAVGIAALALGALGTRVVNAQVFGPPSTLWGSITDEAGTVPEGVHFQVYVGDTVCGRGVTQFYGEGSARVTVYYADVVSREQTPGCGFDGAEMRIKVGDRFADDTARWRQGPVHLDLTFGAAAAAPIPTATPAPRVTTGAGAQVGGAAAPTEPGGTGTGSARGTPRPGQTILPGSLGGSQTQASLPTTSDGGGFPVWAALLLALGGVAAVGGGVGYAMSRSARQQAADAGDHRDEAL